MTDGNKYTMLDKEIGQRIGILRGNETQEELASAIGVSREIIQHWEKGTRKIKANHLYLLSEHFGKSVDYLLGLVEEDKSTNDKKLRIISETTGLSNDAVKRLIEWYSSDDRKKLFPTYLSKIITSKNAEPLFAVIGEFLLLSYLEDKTANTNDLESISDIMEKQMARLWNISRLFSNTIDELGAAERSANNGKH